MGELNYLESIARIYGNDETIVAYQKTRYTRLIDLFKSKYDERSYNIFRTPGRTEISGNHTDHSGGLVLAASVNLDSISVAAANSSSIISIFSEGFDELYIVNLNDLDIQMDEREQQTH